MLRITKLIALALFAVHMSASAASPEDTVKENLQRLLPANMQIESIAETPMENVYMVTAGSQSLYVYSVGDFVMIGDVYDAVRKVNLGEEMRNEKMAEALASIPESEMIIMGESTDRYVTVFTDTDCGYCQKFHQHVAELQSMGMQVRYLMFPRAGINSASYDEAVSVWCAEDQREAMTIAKAGGTVEPKVCENPVEKQYRLGQRLGVRGTPTMVLDSGKVIPGFLPPAQLLAEAEMEY
jgi:thiol:disulfide interchange protein DsbC